jgi:hypothetical protein
MKSSKLFSINIRDIAKGIILAVLSAVITFLYSAIQAGDWWNKTTLKEIGVVALTAFLAYVIKNFLTNSSDGILKPEK